MCKRMERSEPAILPPDIFETGENEPPSRSASADSSPPSSEESDEDIDHVIGDCLWEKELLGIAVIEIKNIHDAYGLKNECGMMRTARSVFRVTRMYVNAFPCDFLTPRNGSANTLNQSEILKTNYSNYDLVAGKAQALVHTILHSCRLVMSDYKTSSDAKLADLEREHAEIFLKFMHEGNGRRFVLGKGFITEGHHPLTERILSAEKEQLVNDVRSAKARVMLKRRKPTQMNVAMEYGAPRKTMMDRLKKHGIHLKDMR